MWTRTSKQSGTPQRSATSSPAQAQTQQPQPAEGAAPETTVDATRTFGFFRRHPVLTIAGAAGIGLLGGIEMALGVALGAGVAAFVRPKTSQPGSAEPTKWGARAQELFDQGPAELRKRARAVLEAARGRLTTEAEPHVH